MLLSEQEKLMYMVMKAIYDSGIPIEFKGAMVLKACLLEAGFSGEIRHTADIDANWCLNEELSSEQMTMTLQDALTKSGIMLDIKMYRMYGPGRSAGFDLIDQQSREILFSLDVDINRPVSSSKIYEISGIRFRGVSQSQMMADKISAISSEHIFRRIKDIVDLYYMSQVFVFNRDTLTESLLRSERSLGSFDGFLHHKAELKHAYEKYRFSGDINKPTFEEVYTGVKHYINDILPKERQRELER